MMRWIDVIRCRLRSLFRRGRVDAELDRELRFHLDQRVHELVAEGYTADDARLAAAREFGSVASIAEQCRDTRRVTFLSNLAQDLRYAVRVLAGQPLLVGAATVSIALGVGANLAVFGLANELLLSTPTADRPERLVHIRTGSGSHVPFHAWRAFSASGMLQGIAGHQIEAEVNWRGPNASVTLTPLIVTANYFDVVRAPFAIGRGFAAYEAAAESEPRVVVVSHGFWSRQLGGDPNIVGKSIVLNGEPYVVTGVLPRNLRSLPGYGLVPDVYVPISKTLMPDIDHPRAASVQLIGRLRDDQTVEQARAALATVAARIGNEHDSNGLKRITVLAPVGGLEQVHEIGGGIGAFFGMLLAVTFLVLAIACANVAGLLLARGTARTREIALRLALGASRVRLVQQLLAEGLVLSLIGTASALALIAVADAFLSRLILPLPISLQLHLSVDGRLMAVAVALALVSTALSSLVPAMQATKPSMIPALKQEPKTYGHRRITVRAVLVGGQIAISVLLLATTLLFLKNLARANSMQPGFETERTLVGRIMFVEGRQNLPASSVERMVERLRSVPGVESAAFASGVPLTVHAGSQMGTDLRIEGRADLVPAQYAFNLIGPDYFRTMGIRLIGGRDFTTHDRVGAPAVVVVNQEFVRRYLGGENPIGRELGLPGADKERPATIVGVAADGKYRSIGEDPQPAMYESYLQRGNRARRVHVLVRTTRSPQTLASTVRDAVLQVDSSAAVSVEPMTSALSFAFLPSRIGAVLVGTLGALGTLLAMVGLYGIVSFAVSRRTSEIGIRMALGAPRRAILRLVMHDGAILVGLGILVGLAVGFVVTKPLAAFLVAGLETADPWTFAGTALLLALTSSAACWAPARRATRIEPSLSLRAE